MPEIPHPDSWLRRKALAEALSAAGYPIARETLATYASRGGGPEFHYSGRFPIYRWGHALAWAKTRSRATPSHPAAAYRREHPTPVI